MQTPPEPKDVETAEIAANSEVVRMNIDESAGHVRKAAYWFYAIAALSVINVFLQAKGSYFIAGLALPSFVDGFLALGSDDASPNYFIHLTGAAIFILFGFFASRLQRWAFIAGALVYILDAAVYAFIGEWLALAFHFFILYKLYQGFRTIGEYEAIVSKAKHDATSPT